MNHKKIVILVLGMLVGLGLVRPAWGWHGEGHQLAAQAALKLLPDSVPAFFREGSEAVAHYSLDPDVVRNRKLPQLRDAEGPEHFMDIELLKGRPLPEKRYQYVALCQELGVDPSKVGLLPYAMVEGAQRLAVAFAEHRKWPENPYIKAKALVLAGHLSHYAADLTQPLHVTIHFDGRVGQDGRSPRSGIHDKVDGLPEFLKPSAGELAKGLEAREMQELMPSVIKAIEVSHSLVDQVYALEAELPTGPEGALTPKVEAFTLDRMQRATELTASLFLTAWKQSEGIELDSWLKRE